MSCLNPAVQCGMVTCPSPSELWGANTGNVVRIVNTVFSFAVRSVFNMTHVDLVLKFHGENKREMVTVFYMGFFPLNFFSS